MSGHARDHSQTLNFVETISPPARTVSARPHRGAGSNGTSVVFVLQSANMFPDIANVFYIREALWRYKELGSASIMVGAGFSRNADPISLTARPMPNWAELGEALCHPLYPTDDARRRLALSEASGTSGFLRLAQEYQVAFGVSALSNKIRSLVPDNDYQPGDLHKRLLRLPWADVFSPNWDTLLERTCVDVFERSYDIVRTLNEIPFAKRPRIVKPHGSFPAHERLSSRRRNTADRLRYSHLPARAVRPNR